MDLFSLSAVLFFIMDPFGNVASCLKTLQPVPEKRRPRVVLREMSVVLAVMLLFDLIGEQLFFLLQLSETAVQLSAGVILFLTAIKILFSLPDSPRAQVKEEEPFFVPLAIPLLAGPSLLATLMLFAHIEKEPTLMLSAIFLAWIAATLVLLATQYLHKYLGHNGLLALEKLMGMLLLLLSIQRFAEGVRQFVCHCLP